MFWWLLVAIAAGALMLLLQCAGVLFGYREGTPDVWHALGLLLSVALLGATMPVIVFLDYKAQKKKGTVTRLIPMFERALELADRQRERQDPEKEP